MPRDHVSGILPPRFARVSGAPSDLPAFIGPYRILGRLGEGGMGVVYLAEQSEPIRREVALKVLQVDARSDLVVARFESERQALAVMEHPGITKVFDAGTTPAGWPYFVMERVDGVSITEYADNHRLDLRARVRLFVQVCNAVQHAHQKGIIHRDLKPSNVLVTEADGAPLCKIIDFGIAKATETTGSSKLTRTGLAIGTPAYMSPEQAMGSGLDVDTRSDIYSMGVLLYELVAGELPFDATAVREQAMMALHVSEEAPAPSARFAMLPAQRQREITAGQDTDPGSLRRALRGDLDNVVMKTLEKERERRYPTANDLAADLERYLDDKPVLATPQSGLYRARKFVRRHRVGVAFAATVLALLVTFAVAVSVQAGRLARARAALEARQGQSEELIGFMLGDLRSRLAPIGRLELLDAVGTRALAYFAAVPESELSNTELFRRSVALRQLGEVRMDQGKPEAAMDAFRQSLTLASGLARRNPDVDEWQLGLGTSHFWIGAVHWQRGELDSAGAHFAPYLSISQSLVAKHPDSLAYRLEVAQAQSNLGSVREAKGDLAGALAAFHASVAAKEELGRRDSTNMGWRLDLADSYNNVAVVQRKIGDLTGAEANHRRELAVKRSLVARDSTNMTYARRLALGHVYLGDLLITTGDETGAVAQIDSAHAIFQRLVAEDTSNAEWRRGLANSERVLGQALLEQGDVAGAVRALGSSRARAEREVAAKPDNRAWQNELQSTRAALGEALSRIGRRDDALALSRAAVATGTASLARKPADRALRRALALAQLSLGGVLSRAGDTVGARSAFASAATLVDSTMLATGQTELLAIRASALLQLARVDEARPLVEELLRRGYRRPSFVVLATPRTSSHPSPGAPR